MPTPVVDGLGRTIAAVLALLTLGGCALFRPTPPRGLELTHVRTDVSTDELGRLALRSEFAVENPNAFDVRIVEVERTLRLESSPFRSDAAGSDRLVRAGDVAVVVAHLDLAGREMLDALPQEPEDGLVPASFQLAVRTNQRELDPNEWYSAEWQGSLPLLLAPRIRFLDLERESLSALEADLHLVLELTNPNVFAVHLRSFEAALEINDTGFGIISSADLDRWIPAGGTIQMRVSRSYRLAGSGNEIFRVLAHEERLAVDVRGTARFGFDSPLSPVDAKLHAAGTVPRRESQ